MCIFERSSTINIATIPLATVTDGDFSSLSVPLTFLPGSNDSAEMCTSVMALYDDLVEFEEYFTVTLTLGRTSVTGLKLGNSETVVAVINSDGM